MRIQSLSEPVLEIDFLNAGRGPGKFYSDKLPVHTAKVQGMPAGLAAIVVTADLQGRETFADQSTESLRLLGSVLPLKLTDDVLPSLSLPAGRVGVVLAGDFYTVPNLDKRGGTGDVTEVWDAFDRQFDWVVGVAGNHDLFGNSAKPPQRFGKSRFFLDGDTAEVDQLRFAGVSGIIGNPTRNWRRPLEDYCDAVESAAKQSPDILVLHDGPDHPSGRGRGSTVVRELLEMVPPTLVVRGHAHWDQPLAELGNGTQVLNVDARCVILRAT